MALRYEFLIFYFQGKYLILGDDAQENWNSIAQFSKKDADAYVKYEEFLGKYGCTCLCRSVCIV